MIANKYMPGRVFTPYTRENMAVNTRHILKVSSRFPKFDASNAWQMGHKSQEVFSLGQELLLDFAAPINLPSNADKSITIGFIMSYHGSCGFLVPLLAFWPASANKLEREIRLLHTLHTIT